MKESKGILGRLRGAEDSASSWPPRYRTELLSRAQVLGVGERETLVAAELLVHLKRGGTPVGLEDVLIGAIARSYRSTVVTHTVQHFKDLPGVQVEDWFE